MKKRKKEIQMRLHQHRTITGNVFGKAHPVKAIHLRKRTQISHELTLEREEIDNE